MRYSRGSEGGGASTTDRMMMKRCRQQAPSLRLLVLPIIGVGAVGRPS